MAIAYYGYIWAAFALTVSVAARYASALEQKLGTRHLLYLVGLLPLVGLAFPYGTCSLLTRRQWVKC